MNSKPGSMLWWAIVLSTIASVLAGIGPAVELLPEAWRAPARGGFAVLGILIALLLRSVLFDRDHNGIPDVLEPKAAEPPRINGPGAAAVLLVALFVVPPLPLVAGCGASALQVQAVAADYAGIAVEAAGGELLEARGHALEVAVSSSSTREDAQAAVDAVRLHYAPAVLAFDSLRIAHGLWVDVLGLAAAGNIDDPLRWARLAASVVVAWDSWASSAEGLGLEVPRPPGMLLAVAAMVPAPAAVPAVSP